MYICTHLGDRQGGATAGAGELHQRPAGTNGQVLAGAWVGDGGGGGRYVLGSTNPSNPYDPTRSAVEYDGVDAFPGMTYNLPPEQGHGTSGGRGNYQHPGAAYTHQRAGWRPGPGLGGMDGEFGGKSAPICPLIISRVERTKK